ncbi:MAG TPA: HEAT repeat domain-containing protein, partial [Gemmataceae bacterium]|nr:HEAT repeat domain-containing protein [Gemmataceae bacterium]
MSTTVKSLTYRGDVKAAVGVGSTLVFVTVHPEGHPTGVHRLDTEKLSLAVDPLPAGGTALINEKDILWVGGSDNRIYQASSRGGAPTPLGPPLAATPIALALLANDRLAVLGGTNVIILSRKDGKVLQTLDLPDMGTCLAADPTGQWLVAGTVKGIVTVFDGEGKAEFLVSESEKLHEGAVTALLFELEELRFFSAGADNKLLSTHARGKLEPEDRGKGSNHAEPITAILWGPGDRFYTGSRDKTVKSWPRTGGAKPATVKDGIGKVVALTLVQVYQRPHLVVGCDDNSFRFYVLDAAGKVGDQSHRINDAYAWARYEFAQDDARRREAALRTLAGFNDTPSIELISEQVGKDADHALRKLAAQLLGESNHPRAAKLLEQWLQHADEAVRVAALEGLRKHLGEQDLRPLDWALNVEKADVGRLAVQALEALAARDDQALTRLMEALDHKTPEVRQAALVSLERVHPADSPEANLIALGSKHADLRRLTLIRLFQRQMLHHARVQAALRWRMEDDDAAVRGTAFLLSLYTRPKLVPALRSRDPELHRQLHELETFSLEEKDDDKKEGKKAQASRPKEVPLDLEESDYDPLLQATASRALDTCLRGARGLAVLGDARAFSLLLQLSREPDAAARAEVCRALAALDDPRSIQRLRSLLYDPEATVRDAAFSALEEIHGTDPLLAAEAGLSSSFEDVRKRALQVLIRAVRKAPPTKADEPAWQLLVRALNDNFPGVRSEAFKAALNLQIAGGGVNTLRFVLQSIHADIRLEVLTELMAQAEEEWAWNLLLEFYNDHDPALRSEAFAFASSKKTKELTPLEAGLRSQYADIRKKAVEALIKKHTPAAQALLVKALDDPEKEVRQLALESLVGADARGALAQALNSPHADIRVRAGKALARHGDSTALAPLLALATVPEPPEKERRPDWQDLACTALAGLAQLGDPAALPHLVPLLGSKHDMIRKNAAFALTWCALPHQVETLRQALQHADPQVKYHAALGLAYAGDPLAASLVFAEQADQVLTDGERLVAAFTLGPAGEEQLLVWLDHHDDKLRNWALLLLMLVEMKAHQGTPRRCLACLSSRMPRVRLTAARGLEAFADPAAFQEFVVGLFNDRGDEPAWKVPAETVDTVAELLVYGSPPTRARTAQLLRYLSEKEQAPWNQAWAIHEDRFGREIAALRQQAAERPAPPLQYRPEQLRQLAFGAYVGLVREQGGQGAAGSAVVRVRQTALSRILALAHKDEEYARAAQPVFIQALGDPNQAVRMQAFEQLQALGMDSAALGAEALEAGHTDLGVRGLQLLTGRASAAEGEAVLERVMLTRNDDLAIEAAKLLMAQR